MGDQEVIGIDHGSAFIAIDKDLCSHYEKTQTDRLLNVVCV